MEPVSIDSPSQEYPTPSEVSACLVVRVGRETEPLVVITYGVVFVIGEMVEHQGVIVLVGADIGVSKSLKLRNFFSDFPKVFLCTTLSYAIGLFSLFCANNENVNNIHKQKKPPLCILLFSLIYTKLNKITGFKQYLANFSLKKVLIICSFQSE